MNNLKEINLFKNVRLSAGNIIFISSFILSLLGYLILLKFRGFGWDGDSFNSALQFVYILNRNIYPCTFAELGTMPKTLTILLFGITYRLFGNFYVLTFIAITLNALAIAFLCKWIFQLNGHWTFTLIGIIINISWGWRVLSCDNPVFSFPFVIFGLYYYFHKSQKIKGAFLILIASLFRPGPEIILFFMIIFEIWKRNKRFLLPLFAIFVLAVLNMLFCHLLVFSSRESFNNLCLTALKTVTYGYSISAVYPYIRSVLGNIRVSTISIILLIPAFLGFLECMRSSNSIRFIILAGFVSYLVPVGSFIYGVDIGQHYYCMEWMLLIPIFASFFRYEKLLDINIPLTKIVGILVIITLMLYLSSIGKRHYGFYEINPINGTGYLNQSKKLSLNNASKLFKNRIKSGYRALTNDPWFILDFGDKAKSIDLVRKKNELKSYDINVFDLIVIPRDFLSEAVIDDATFEKRQIDGDRIIIIKREFLK